MSLPETIKALQIQPDRNLKVVDIPFSSQDKVKNLSSNEVIIKVHAVAINPTDWKHSLLDIWGDALTISGCDASGEVVKVGSAVKHVKVGDRVFAFLFGAQSKENGAYAEYARFNENVVAPIPAGMSYEEAAGFPIPHLTAFQYLFGRLSFPFPSSITPSSSPSSSPKTNILVWGGATAVGHHAVQLAHLAGCRVITTASTKHHEFLKSIGADVTIDYKDPDVDAKLKEAVKEGGGGLKYAVDTVSEHGSIDHILETLTEKGSHVMTTLPTKPKKERADTKVEFALVYSLMMDKSFKFGRTFDIEPILEENIKSREWVSKELPKILDGWVEGKGSKNYQGQKLKLGKGLANIQDGLVYMKEGNVSGEKLVYTI